MMIYKELSSDFQIVDQNYGVKFNKNMNVQLLQKDGKNFISFNIKQLNLDQKRSRQMRRFKYFNILQPQYYYLINKSLVFNDILNYQLTQQKFKELAEVDYRRILIQLLLIFNEVEHRKLDWQINDFSQLYYIDGILQIVIFDYVQNQDKQQREKLFKEFIYNNFLTYIPQLEESLNSKKEEQFKNLLESLFNEEKISSGQLGVYAFYEEVVKWLLDIENFQVVYNSHLCIIKQFNKTKQIMKLMDNAPEDLIFKQKKVHKSYKYYQEISQNIDREIEISEKNSDYKQLSSCVFYLRIFDKPFLFMKYYKQTLSDIFELWKQENPQYYKLKVYKLCDSLSIAIFELQQGSLIHRDLKPQNLFLNDWDEKDIQKICDSLIIIGDFDRSKGIQSNKNVEEIPDNNEDSNETEQEYMSITISQNTEKQIMTIFNSENTVLYDPPETIQSFQYDIWQYGLICLSIANRGIFAGCNKGGRAIEDSEYNQYFSSKAIQATLKNENYPQQFLDMLANCLKKDYTKRPKPENKYK